MKSKQPKQPNPYNVDRLALIPKPIKAIVIKWWFAGAVFFFMGMGVPALHKADNLDLIVALGIVMGMVNDILVNNIFRYMRTDRADYDNWMVFPKKKLISFFLNIIYYIAVALVVTAIYSSINIIALKASIVDETAVFLPVEPVGYGVFVLIVDLFVLGVKALFRKGFSNKKVSE